jgi:pheromone a factor receptor
MVDLAIGVGLPVLAMALHYIIQGHRFNIFEDVGCYPDTVYVWPIYPILYLPPIFIGLFSGTYAVLTIIAFYKNHAQFKAMLSGSQNVTSNRFIRLMCLASVELLFNIPLSLYGISLEAPQPLNPWISWQNIHSNFSRVELIPALIWRNNRETEIALELNRWAVVFCAFIFFAFFGFADEARKNYRYAFQSVAKRVGISTVSFGSGLSSSGFLGTGSRSKGMGSSGKVRPELPLFVHQEMLQRRDSMDSFSNMSIADVGDTLKEKSDPEKQDFYPTMSYGGLSIPELGKKGTSLSSASSQTLSAASSITYPTPARTRVDSRPDAIEISSVQRDSSYSEPTDPSPTSNSSPHPIEPSTAL